MRSQWRSHVASTTLHTHRIREIISAMSTLGPDLFNTHPKFVDLGQYYMYTRVLSMSDAGTLLFATAYFQPVFEFNAKPVYFIQQATISYVALSIFKPRILFLSKYTYVSSILIFNSFTANQSNCCCVLLILQNLLVLKNQNGNMF